LPRWADLNEGWSELLPAGDTVCSRGTEYAFFVRKGTVDRVVFEFEGGGACWNAETCSVAGAIFKETIDEDRAVYASGEENMSGLLARDERNPFRDWHHVYVPYCTGDVHAGEAVVEYGEGAGAFTIHHSGAINARAALQWAFDEAPAPDRALVTGCSAGAYGSIWWTPSVAKAYPDAQVVQFGDSGAGIITDNFLQDSFPVWNAVQMLPPWIPELDPATIDISEMSLNDIYTIVADFYPEHRLAQFNTVNDEVQVFYYQAMGGGEAAEWSAQMRASMRTLAAAADNFRYYVAPGNQHCIIPWDNFYTTDVGGVPLPGWLEGLFEGDPASVACDGCLDEEGPGDPE